MIDSMLATICLGVAIVLSYTVLKKVFEIYDRQQKEEMKELIRSWEQETEGD